jgi:hypothetical protein
MLPNFFTAGPQPPWAVGGALRTFPRRWRGPGKELADIGVFILFCTDCAADEALQPARGCTGVRRLYFRGARTLSSTPRHFPRPADAFPGTGQAVGRHRCFCIFFWLLSPITVLLRHSRGGVRAEKLFLGRARALSNTWEPFIRPVDTSAGLGQAVIEGFIFAVLGSFSGFANWGEAVLKAT